MTLLHEARERVRTDMKRPMGDFNEPQVLRVCRLSFLDEKLAKTPDDRDLEFNFIYLYSQYAEAEKVDSSRNREENWQAERKALAPLFWLRMNKPDKRIRELCDISKATLRRVKNRPVSGFLYLEFCTQEDKPLTDAEGKKQIAGLEASFDKALGTPLCEMGWGAISVNESLAAIYSKHRAEMDSDPEFWEHD